MLSATPISGNQMLQDAVESFDSIITQLLPVPTDDISSFITGLDMPADYLKRVFRFVDYVIA